MFSSGPGLTDRLLSPSYAIENNIPAISIRCGPEPIRQYTKSDGTYFTGTTSQLRGYNELQYWEAQGVRLDRIRKSPTVGIPYAISIHSGASPETQEFVYGMASSIDGMATAYGGMRGATGTPFIANQRGFTMPSRNGPTGAIPTTIEEAIRYPGSFYGRSATEIAQAFTSQGFGATVHQSTRGSQRATIVKVEGHPDIAQIQVHPGGGRHIAPYIKISTSTVGTIKIIEPGYKMSGEKATFIWMGE